MKIAKFTSAALILCLLSPAAFAQNQLWITQFGSNGADAPKAIAIDGPDGVLVAGNTTGDLGGPSAGGTDVFLARYDTQGNQIWVRQFGTNAGDFAYAVATDGAGGAFIAGSTSFGVSSGHTDAFLCRYDADGNQLWYRQFGTFLSSVARAVVADGVGGVFVTGGTSGRLGAMNWGFKDVFLAHYDSQGNLSWIRQYGTNEIERALAAVSDGAGGLFVTGEYTLFVGGFPFDRRSFVARYNSDGDELWNRILGDPSNPNETIALAPDSGGGVFVTGIGWDGNRRGPFLSRYDSNGNQLWTPPLGHLHPADRLSGLTTDGEGGVVLSGNTGDSYIGVYGFLTRLDSTGDEVWTEIVTNNWESASGVAFDGAGNVIVMGSNGEIFLASYTIDSCYADCDQSNGAGVLDLFDFLCFQNSFVSGEPYACDCDTSTGNGVCDLFDFLCFQGAFVGGCP